MSNRLRSHGFGALNSQRTISGIKPLCPGILKAQLAQSTDQATHRRLQTAIPTPSRSTHELSQSLGAHAHYTEVDTFLPRYGDEAYRNKRSK